MQSLLVAAPAAPHTAFLTGPVRKGRSGAFLTARCIAPKQQAAATPAEAPPAPGPAVSDFDRRSLLLAAALTAGTAWVARGQRADAADMGAMTDTIGDRVLCDADCVTKLAAGDIVTTASGLQYQDIIEGRGPVPEVGYQVVVNYVAMTSGGRIFDNSLAKNAPYYIRVGTGQVVAGLDEGLLTMKTGGLRRLYVPGSLAFPKGLASGPGRPRILPNTPVVFDVQLAYIPGISDDLEDF